MQRPNKIAVVHGLNESNGLPFMGCNVIVTDSKAPWKKGQFNKARVLRCSHDSAHYIRAEGVAIVYGEDDGCVTRALESCPDPLIIVVCSSPSPNLFDSIAKKAVGREVRVVVMQSGSIAKIDASAKPDGDRVEIIEAGTPPAVKKSAKKAVKKQAKQAKPAPRTDSKDEG